MWVPPPYKQTKNQINTTTGITVGSCYREAHWNSKVSTNGQNPTFSHLSARSHLRNRQWPSSHPCVARHRQLHQEKEPHFSEELAKGCWNQKKYPISQFGAFYPWIFTLRLNYSHQCQIIWVTACGWEHPTSRPKIKSMRPLTLQLGHVIERYIEIQRSAQMVKIRHFLTFLPVRSSETDNDYPHLLV